MKKLIIVAILAVFSLNAFAQQGAMDLLPKLGYQTEHKRFLVGVEGRYSITNNIRLAPDIAVLFPKDHLTGLDVNINVHYLIPLAEGFTFYPYVGGAMLNNRFSYSGVSNSFTDFGLNLGAGLSYDVTDNGYLDFQFKYTIVDGSDPAYFMLGYGIRF
jgi:outer membrane protein X